MNLVERIKELMDTHELSAAAFSDRIGVQRSSISHILSERNKPSLDFVLKILNAFPTVSSDWLLMGQQQHETLFTKTEPATNPSAPSNASVLTPLKNEAAPSVQTTANQVTTDLPSPSNRDVERVVVFYTDGTCSTYLNKK